ncbi:HAD family hydrolase [Actinomadura violacea]|uniref:HAD family hydrolase n=1 Tax=Actinomadura violacea TaxID=2819934 RepID=A0ABS3RXQ1_9ACTN|nr:HAD family hydrolase [Actinomadura violacea]MBO2461533.1 HAD family hydrolase [Actinomadura violacea]
MSDLDDRGEVSVVSPAAVRGAGVPAWAGEVRCVAVDYGGVLDLPVQPDDGASTPGLGYEGFLAANLGADARRLDARRSDSSPVDPAAAEAVRALVRNGLAVLVASNTLPDRLCDRRLDQAGIRGLLLAVIQSHVIGVRKPDPEFFATIAEVADAAPRHCCYVGNRIETDIVPALAAGMRAVLIAGPADRGALEEQVPTRVPVLGHLRELPALLGRRPRGER